MNPTSNKMSLFLASLFYVIRSIIIISFAFVMQATIDISSTGDIHLLVRSLMVLVAMVAAEYLVVLLAARFRLDFAKEGLVSAKHRRLNFIFSRKSKGLAEDSKGELSFFTADADIIYRSNLNPKARLASCISEAVLALVALMWINWIVTLVVILVSLLPVFATRIFAKGLDLRKKQYSDQAAKYVDVVSECLNGKDEIKAYGKQDVFMGKHQAMNRQVESVRQKSEFFSVLAGYTSSSLGRLTVITTIGLSIYFVIVDRMTFGYMFAIILLMESLMHPLTVLAGEINEIRSSKSVVEKSKEKSEKEKPGLAMPLFTGSIGVHSLGLRYTDEDYIFKGISLSFERGKKYAILAPSGYGKTSLARAIAGECTDFDGTITIDGTDIQEISSESYHQVLRYIRQSPYLFSGTLLENLTFFDESVNKEDIKRVLEIAAISDFQNDAELKRVISDTSGLSGGQKQRIVLARALLQKPQVLILDEITSGVDIETSLKILKRLFTDRQLTCIALTHETNEDFLGLFDEVIRLNSIP